MGTCRHWHQGAPGSPALGPERQCAGMSKNEKGELDQYGAEHFGRLIFATIIKSVGLKWLTVSSFSNAQNMLISTFKFLKNLGT